MTDCVDKRKRIARVPCTACTACTAMLKLKPSKDIAKKRVKADKFAAKRGKAIVELLNTVTVCSPLNKSLPYPLSKCALKENSALTAACSSVFDESTRYWNKAFADVGVDYNEFIKPPPKADHQGIAEILALLLEVN